MGQYYRIAFKHESKKVVVNDRNIKGAGYMLAKLMEHSWLGCWIADAVAYEMQGKPMRLAWIGDYADEGDEVKITTRGDVTYEKVWRHGHRHAFPNTVAFNYAHKFLVNHDKRLIVSFDKYRAASGGEYADAVCPFSLLTAIGNDRGGGDYHEGRPDYDKVGTWAWDLISIEHERPIGDGWSEFEVCFKDV